MKIWYSVGNGGDGSAYPHWFESERLTEMDQELMPEGWGECCNGYIEIEGENLKVLTKVTTKEEFIEERLKYIINSTGSYYGEFKDIAQEFLDELTQE